MKRRFRIISLLMSIVLLSCTLLTSCVEGSYKKLEESYNSWYENAIEEFKLKNPNVIESVTYSIVFSEKDYYNGAYIRAVTRVLIEIKASGEVDFSSYAELLRPKVISKVDGMHVHTSTFGGIYINGKLAYSSGMCNFKNNNGERTCTGRSTHGQLCDFHFNMLDDAYNDLVN